MIEVRLTYAFREWRDGLRDSRAKAAIARRIDPLASGNPGDTKFLGKGVSELRIDHGPGYRVYYMRRGALLIVLLCGGDKSTQSKDIAEAMELAANWTDEEDEA
ncbi:MAG: type II toxin-antitoxin system RelE/ParE family toxin [Roseiarcus sp.]